MKGRESERNGEQIRAVRTSLIRGTISADAMGWWLSGSEGIFLNKYLKRAEVMR
jgi:hypothetical protein